jgi:lipopolysaccharide export system protein LptA
MVLWFPSKKLALFGLAVLFFGLQPIFAADPINFSAESVKSSFEKNNERTTLSGNAKVSTGSLTIQADLIEIAGTNKRYVQANGNVRIRDNARNIIMQGQVLQFDRTQDLVKISGAAMIEDFENKIVIRAGAFEYRLQDNLAIMNAGVRIYKDDLEARSEFATYQRDLSTLELNGRPEVTKGKDTYRAGSIRVNTATDEIQLLGAVSGDIGSQGSSP